jgi:hypothetical protein
LLGDGRAAAELGRAARQTARETFDIRRTVDRTALLYRGILSRAPLRSS